MFCIVDPVKPKTEIFHKVHSSCYLYWRLAA